MEKNTSLKSIKPGSEKNFGYVFSLFFLVIALWPLINLDQPNIFFIILFVFFLIITLTKPKVFKIPNLLWFKFGMILGNIISPIIMTLIYFLIFIPIGVILKLFGKDILNKKLNKNENSYWQNKKANAQSMKDQF